MSLNDSTKIYRTDTNWLDTKICLQLKIDTINTRLIKKIRKSPHVFYYKKQIYDYQQLFDLKYLNDLVSTKIISFEVSLSFNSEISSVKENSNCLNDSQKEYIENVWRTLIHEKRSDFNFMVYLYQVRLSNNFYYNILNMNGVICYISQNK